MNPIMEMGQLNRQGMRACQDGDLKNAEFLLRQALMRSRACTSPLPGAKVRHNLALILIMQGRTDEARSLLAQALDTVTQTGLTKTRFHERIRSNLEGLAA
ncbi:hypothetical protein JCM16814_01810 [Desulfobaculum senezii]|uniref:tetratricopeptide repeat protein n=1 Tax=Desulfobaculum sp. SPO524 TaxID=3378071 RepID=UPI0038524CF1